MTLITNFDMTNYDYTRNTTFTDASWNVPTDKLTGEELQVGWITHSITDFWVDFHLSFKANPSAKPLMWRLVLFTCKVWFIYMWIKLMFTWKGSLETDTKGNSEVTYHNHLATKMYYGYVMHNRLTLQGNLP